MSPLEQTLLIVTSQSPPLRRALQRWALRYAGRVLFKLGGVHLASADLLQALGETVGEHTMIGRPPSTRVPAAVQGGPVQGTRIGRPPSARAPSAVQGTPVQGTMVGRPPSTRPPSTVQGTRIGRPPSTRPPAPPTKQPPAPKDIQGATVTQLEKP